MAEERVEAVRPAEFAADGVTCCIWRELTGAGIVAGVIPANTYACINVVAQGTVATAAGAALPDAFVTGPFSVPLATLATAPLRSLSIVLEPWTLQTWLGLEPARMVDVLQDLHALPARAGWFERFVPMLREAVEDRSKLGVALAALTACAERKPAHAQALARALLECESPAQAARRSGRSTRQFQRVFVRHFGLAPRVWLQLRRFEAAVERLSTDAPATTLAAVAQDAGYADQAHMSRQFRAVGAASPTEVRSALTEKKPGTWVLQAARGTSR